MKQICREEAPAVTQSCEGFITEVRALGAMCSVHERNDKKLMIKTYTLTVGKDTGARVRRGDGHQHDM